MKFRISLQHVDGVEASVDSEVERFIEEMQNLDDIPILKNVRLGAEELEELEDQHREMVRRHIRQWLRHGENVTLEFDTDAGTCTVVKP